MPKKLTKHIVALLVLLFLAAGWPAQALAAGPELKNGSLAGEGIPESWSVLAYVAESSEVSADNGVVTISANDYNDVRLTQLVEVEPNTVYTLSGDLSAYQIAGGRGASLSIDNFSVDGAYIYSDGILGSSDWQRVSLSFRTGEDQKIVNVALRLGGYSELSRGSARFRDIRLETGKTGEANVQQLMAGYPSAKGESETGLSEARKIQLKSYLHLFVVSAVAVGVLLLFGVYRNRETLGTLPVSRRASARYFLLAVLLATVLRSVLASLWGGHDTDMSCWMGWGNYIAQYGPSEFYTAPGHDWYDYPPGYMLVLGFIARVLQALKIPGSADSAVFAYMLPAWFADIVTAVVLMNAARKEQFSEGWCLLLGVLVIVQPAGVVLSGAWGQIDSILTLFLVLSFLELIRGRRVSAGALYGLAIMFKWQALMFGPVLAAAYLLHLNGKKAVRDTVLGVLAAVAVIFVFTLPFKGSQGLLWFVGRFLNAAGGYDYASVEAYNFLALLDGNWAPAGNAMLLGIPFKTFGTVAIVLSVYLAIHVQARDAWIGRKSPGYDDPAGTLFLAAGGCMYMIFTFGHYMHERYVYPVILLLLFAFVFTRERRFLFCSLLLSVVVFLNEMTAMFVISNLASAAVRSTREHRAVVSVCSLAETISFLYFAWVMISHAFLNDRKETEHA